MDDFNEYTPWVEQGTTELEYFKKAFLDAEDRVEKLKKHDCKRWRDEGMGCSICVKYAKDARW